MSILTRSRIFTCKHFLLVVMAAILLLATPLPSRADDEEEEEEEECAVCRGVVRKVLAGVDSSSMSDESALEAAMDKFCKTATLKEKTFCYYVTTIKREFSKPAAMGAPVDRICKKLSMKDASVCELKYKAKSTKSFIKDMAEEKLSKMRVKEIRALLGRFDRECKGCADKEDFLNEIRALRAELEKGGEL